MNPYTNYIVCGASESLCPHCQNALTWMIPATTTACFSSEYPLFLICRTCDAIQVQSPTRTTMEEELHALPYDVQLQLAEVSIKVLKHQDTVIRQRAVRILSGIGPSIIAILTFQLAKRIRTLQRKAIIEVLGNIRDERAAEVLIEALTHKDTRYEARMSLERLKHVAFAPIQKVLSNADSTSKLRGTLLSILYWGEGLTQAEQISEALENLEADADTRMWAAQRLGELPSEHTLSILRRANAKEWHPEVRGYIEASIKSIQERRSK